MATHLDVIVIYDGECRFCRACLTWLQERLQVTAVAFQDADLAKYGLTRSQCEQAVFVIAGQNTYSGSAAIALLFNLRGNTLISKQIKKSGGLGRLGYRWLASHRNSLLVRLATRCLERITAHKN